jgi:hypothetical protein
MDMYLGPKFRPVTVTDVPPVAGRLLIELKSDTMGELKVNMLADEAATPETTIATNVLERSVATGWTQRMCVFVNQTVDSHATPPNRALTEKSSSPKLWPDKVSTAEPELGTFGGYIAV